MKLSRKILVIIMAVLMVLGSYPNTSSAAPLNGTVKSIKVTSTPANILVIKKGQKYKLKVKVKGEGKFSKKVSYTSANESIATVSSSGRVKGIRKGSTKVTVRSVSNPKVKKTIKVKVGTPVKKVKVTKKKVTLNEGDTYKIKVKLSPKKPTYKKVSFTSSDKTVVKVSKKGKVTALKEGTAVITVRSKDGSNKKAKVTITVKSDGSSEVTTETPTEEPTANPDATPTVEPTSDPNVTPIPEMNVTPTPEVVVTPSEIPTVTPKPTPTRNPEFAYMRFDLGGNGTEEGYIGVSATEAYDESKGYGFGQLHLVKDVPSSGTGALSDAVHFQGAYGAFSVDLKEGIYKITVTTGDCESTTIVAEDHDQLLYMKGTNKTGSFTIPVTDGQLDIYATTGKGEAKSICTIEIEQVSKETTMKPTFWICGAENSARIYDDKNSEARGWGEYLYKYLDMDKYEIRNMSVSSFSSEQVKDFAFGTIEYYGKNDDILLLDVGYVDYTKEFQLHPNNIDPSGLISNVKNIISRAKAKGMTVYLVNMQGTKSSIHRYPLPKTAYFNSVLESIAESENVGLLDVYSSWMELSLRNYYFEQKDYYMRNEAYLNDAGADRMAKLIKDLLFPVYTPTDPGDEIYDFGTTPTAVYETLGSGEAISNPHKGFVMSAHTPQMINSTGGFAYGIGGSADNHAWDVVTIVSGSPKWCKLNPRKGEYDWSEIDEMLEACEAHGLTYGIRIMPYSSYNDEDYVPQWVYDLNAKKNKAKLRDNPSKEVEFPKWDDPIYIQAYKDFTKALAAKYDGDPRVEFIDVRPFGDYGEWHNSFVENGDSYMPSLEIQKDMLDYFVKVFKKSVLALPSNARGEIYRYALSLGITKRDDGLISEPNAEWSLIPTYETNMPVLGENFWPYERMKNTIREDDFSLVNWTPDRFREVIEISHLSIYALDQDSYCSYTFYKEQKNVIDEMCNRLGYNFTVISAERLNNKLAITVKNTGLAPAYFNIQLCAEITDANGNKIKNFGDPVLIKKGTFKDDTQKTFVFDYNGTLPSDATICLAMYDIDNPLVAGKDPTVRFDNKNNLSNKRLKLVRK
ncbi:MAG: Ig-like domain-containing protein [Lachnospiraceae bacterium]|nr:Ig-like domain-containing protein [Eubacterium sp.]MBR5179567.1 Ig-like domain-containing protein [Lachnospiraceae bacterium]